MATAYLLVTVLTMLTGPGLGHDGDLCGQEREIQDIATNFSNVANEDVLRSNVDLRLLEPATSRKPCPQETKCIMKGGKCQKKGTCKGRSTSGCSRRCKCCLPKCLSLSPPGIWNPVSAGSPPCPAGYNPTWISKPGYICCQQIANAQCVKSCGEADEDVCRPNPCKVWEVECTVRKCKETGCHCCKPKVIPSCEVLFGMYENLSHEEIDIIIGRENMERPMDCMDQTSSKSFDFPSPKDIEFRLYTSGIQKDYKRLITNNKTSVDTSSFNSSLPLVVVAHGFRENATTAKWMHQIKDKLFNKGPMNIILVQWAILADSGFELYPVAVRNCRIVGRELAKLLNFLESYAGLSLLLTHIIGHSLGGQLAGVAGYNLNKLAQITGLDPAGPGFYDVGPEDRLDPSDAVFVDVIHTCGCLICPGYKYSCGHVDFRMNGGSSQKGCDNLFCSHRRSHDYYVESLDAPEPSYGFLCEDYDTFLTGHCLYNKHNSLGYAVTSDVGGVFYSNTEAEPTYLARSISIALTVGSTESYFFEKVLVGVIIPGRPLESVRMISGYNRVHTGSSFTKLVTVPSGTTLDSIKVSVQYEKELFPPDQLHVKVIEAYDSFEKKWYCVSGPVDLLNGVNNTFTPTPGNCSDYQLQI